MDGISHILSLQPYNQNHVEDPHATRKISAVLIEKIKIMDAMQLSCRIRVQSTLQPNEIPNHPPQLFYNKKCNNKCRKHISILFSMRFTIYLLQTVGK